MTDPALKARRNPWILGFAAFFNDAASEALLRLVPVYLTEVLGAPLRAVGLMDGLADAMQHLVKPVAGWFSDRTRTRRGWVCAGYGLSGLARGALWFLAAWPQAVAIRLADRFGKGLRNAPKDALLAQARPRDGRGHAFSIDRALDYAGAVSGLLVAAYFLARGGGQLTPALFRGIVLCALLPGVCAMVLPLFAFEAPAEKSAGAAPVAWKPPRELWIFFGLSGLFSLANSSDSFLFLAGRERGFSTPALLCLFAGFNALTALLSPLCGRLADARGRRGMLLAGWLLYAGCYALFAADGGAGLYIAALVAYGAQYALIEGAGKALVGDLSPPAARGRAYGLYGAVQGFALLAGNLLFGALADQFGSRVPLALDALLALLAAAGLMVWRRRAVVGAIH